MLYLMRKSRNLRLLSLKGCEVPQLGLTLGGAMFFEVFCPCLFLLFCLFCWVVRC
jgi:hypothetical protein